VVSFDDVVSGNGGPSLLDAVLKLRSSHDTAIRDCDALHQAVQRLHDAFGPADIVDPLAKIEFVRTQLDRVTAKATARRKKIRALESSLAAAEQSASSSAVRLATVESDLASQTEHHNQTLSDLRATTRSLQLENHSLSELLSRERSEHAQRASALSKEHLTAVSSLISDRDRSQAQLERDLAVLQRNFDALNGEYQSSEARLSRFRKLLQSQRATTKRLESELAEAREFAAAASASARGRADVEKAQAAESSGAAVAEARAQCERHLESLQRVAASLADREARLVQARAAAAQAARERQWAEGEIRALTEQTERQRKMAEVADRSRALALEAQCRERAEAIRAACDAEKRALFAIVANAFPSFFNLAEAFEVRVIRRGIDRVKAEMERLAAAEQEIRRLLGAVEGQTAQDAVAQLVLASAE
jgi:chromosome segregation ATPase